MTPEKRYELIEELEIAGWNNSSHVKEIADIIDRVLSSDGCTHTYGKGRCPHDGCANYKAFQTCACKGEMKGDVEHSKEKCYWANPKYQEKECICHHFEFVHTRSGETANTARWMCPVHGFMFKDYTKSEEPQVPEELTLHRTLNLTPSQADNFN